MANFTSKAIIQTFDEMLEDTSFDKITVSAVVAKCGISSNTFYYHFKDIYDLLDKWLDTKKLYYEEKTNGIDALSDKIKYILHTLQDNPKSVYHVFNSITRERLEKYIFISMEQLVYDYIKTRAGDYEIGEVELQNISRAYCYAFLGFLLRFIWIKMDIDIDSFIDSLSGNFEGALEYLFRQNSKSPPHS